MNAHASMQPRRAEVPPDERDFVLEGGAWIGMRTLQASDEPTLRASFLAVSSPPRRRGLPVLISELSDRMWRRHHRVRSYEDVALAAFTAEGRIVRVARYIRARGERSRAEVAVTVADGWQRRGVGTRLLAMLAEIAEKVGITTFAALAKTHDAGIRRLMGKVGELKAFRVGAEQVLVVQLQA